MCNLKKHLLDQLSECVVEMEEDKVVKVANEYVNNKFDINEGITEGLANGMEKVGELYEEGEYYIPEMLICADTMYNGLDVLKANLKSQDVDEKYKAVVGVIEGDTHDIGKNLFKIMLETVGFEVCDLGSNVAPIDFINKAKEINANLIGVSTLMTTTMENMAEVIELLKRENIREKISVMIGGGPVSQTFAEKIGADGYAKDAHAAANLAKKLVSNN
ncbi:dimethylamine corrinoid protein 2 [Gottschalkia purinilytica]|uniref:Dimethylamine corrinoid protein 2 n=1 Tax=Gottschalkia purinilytica TaxID=1503 RepID=A0A0L0W8W9_GOTPU|nr:corrinoid protein [Gottschalkia purinilytica]KNF07974.1 dimethylamine corrinoid protein 2 [Gottschalkia purinilytica]